MKDVLDILLAAKGDGENWINMLIPVVIVIVYAISGILRMRSNLDKEKPAEDRQKPRYKPLDGQSRDWEQPAAEPATPEMPPAQRRQVDRQIERKLAPEPAVRRQPTPTRPQQRRTLEAFLETVAPPKPLAAAKAQAAAAQAREKRLRAQTAQRKQTAKKIKRKPAPAKAKVAAKKKPSPQPSPITSLAERLAQPDEIRRAIIYAEILGKPIALRDI